MIEFRTMCINVCKCQANEWIVHWYYEMAVQHSQWTIVICEMFGLNDLNSHDLSKIEWELIEADFDGSIVWNPGENENVNLS